MRKQKMYLTGVLMIFILNLNAQFSIGVKAGVASSNMNINGIIGDYLPSTSNFHGFTSGIFVEIPIGKGFYFNPEINYTQKGSVFNPQTTIGIGNTDIPIGLKITNQVNYFEAPMMVKYKLGAGRINFYGEGGLNLAYAKSATLKEQAIVLFDFNIAQQNIDLNNQFINRFDAGAAIGAGGEYVFSSGTKIGLGIRYNQSFRDYVDFDAAADVKNRGWSTQIHLAQAF